jgi:hypothetical protein
MQVARLRMTGRQLLMMCKLFIFNDLARQVGLGPTTLRLTVAAAGITAVCCDCMPMHEKTDRELAAVFLGLIIAMLTIRAFKRIDDELAETRRLLPEIKHMRDYNGSKRDGDERS